MLVDYFHFLVRRLAARRPVAPQARALGIEALEARWVPSASPVISGFVYDDLNGNGVRESNEPALANSKIELRNATGALVGTDVTDAAGRYEFASDASVSTAPTTRTVKAAFPEGKTGWTRTSLLDQFDPALGTLTSIEVIHNAAFTSQIQIENLDDTLTNVTGTVSGKVTLRGPGISPLETSAASSQNALAEVYDGTTDYNGASGHDFGSRTARGTKSVTITDPAVLAQYSGNGKVSLTATAEATSAATGAGNLQTFIRSSASSDVTIVYRYTPSQGLRPGNYVVHQIAQPVGYLDGRETAGNQTPLPGSVGRDQIAITLTGQDSSNNNFGEVKSPHLAGFVYHDQNGNGRKDAGEAGIRGAAVTLTGTNDAGQSVSRSLTTGSDGAYDFTGLRPGTYQLRETQPAGFLDGKEAVGSQGGSAGQDVLTNLRLGSGTNGINNNFGEVKVARLGGFVYHDKDADGKKESGESGIGGATVRLTGTNDLGQTMRLTTRTAASGAYQFSNLRPGNYMVTETQPAGWGDGTDSAGTRGGTVGQDRISNIALASDTSGANYNFGEGKEASLSGFVFLDRDNDGVMAPADPGVGGVTITLAGNDDLGNQVFRTTVSASNGAYSFTGLRPGSYTVLKAHPAGYLDGKDAVGSLGGLAVEDKMFVSLNGGDNGQNYNFALLEPQAVPPFVWAPPTKRDYVNWPF